MTDEVKATVQNYAAPFTPAGPVEVQELQHIHTGDKIAASAEGRIAHALEYIAAQLGDMNRKLDRIIEALPSKEAPKPGRARSLDM